MDDPIHAAQRAHQALRALAHTTQAFESPADSYAVLAALTGGLGSLRQTLEQLAALHDGGSSQAATLDGDRTAGRRQAHIAAGLLAEAATDVGKASRAVDAAWTRNGTISWRPTPTPPTIEPASQPPAARPVGRDHGMGR